MNLKHGVEAKNYEDVCDCIIVIIDIISHFVLLLVKIGKAEKLKPMELELRRLEDLTEAIVNDFAYMRAREEEMRDTNGGCGQILFVGVV